MTSSIQFRKGAGLILGPFLFLVILLTNWGAPSIESHRLAAVMAWVVAYWVLEPIPLSVTALLGSVLAIVMGIASPSVVLAPYANPVIFLFMGSFFLARAMEVHGLDLHLSRMILSRVHGHPFYFLLAVVFITFVFSMWISNSATTAMMIPVVLGALKHMENSKKYESHMILLIAYVASLGGMATLVGTPPNLIGVGLIQELLQIKISFVSWMFLALPLSIMALGLLLFVFRPWPNEKMAKSESHDVKFNRWQIGTMIAFVIAVILWVMPGVLGLVFGESGFIAALKSMFDEATVAILVGVLLLMVPFNKEFKPVLEWQEAVKIDWGTLILFGGGLSLGHLLFDTGLASFVGQGLFDTFGFTSLWGIVFVSIAFASLLSELSSNTATANIVVPVVVSLSWAAGVDPLPPALGAVLGASFGFMFPVGTPPNAIAYGTGKVPLSFMIRKGVMLDLIGIAIIWTGLRLLYPLWEPMLLK